MNYLEPYNFFFELPLYTPIEITSQDLLDFGKLVTFHGRLDGYNPELKEQSTFLASIRAPYGGTITYTPNNYDKPAVAELTCLRSNAIFTYYFQTYQKKITTNFYLIKIGQIPSIADFHISQIKDYSGVLPKEQMKELTRAIGLAANGIGIGSFIYLRRIFEYLIEDAHQKASCSPDWDEEAYQKNRVIEKIGMLKSELPDFLVQHKQLYGILSKGVHELEEAECLRYFMPVRTGIELILDEKVTEKERAEKRAKASLAIQGITTQLGKKGES